MCVPRVGAYADELVMPAIRGLGEPILAVLPSQLLFPVPFVCLSSGAVGMCAKTSKPCNHVPCIL